MSKSIHSTVLQFEKQKVPRFRRLDNDHISAIESLFKLFPFLNERVEIHMPFTRAKSTFSSGTVWLWPKFDKRPVGYLIFIEGFAPCIWYPERQEGMTFRWLLPPNFCQKGATICFANILAGESVLQIEDIVISEGKDLWSNLTFSQRWNKLREFWQNLPADQPLLAFKPRIVNPIPLNQWPIHYDSSVYWIIQPDHSKQPRWFWKDTVTVSERKPTEFIAPMLKRGTEIPNVLVAFLAPYAKAILPDTYSLLSQEGVNLGVASISSLNLSLEIRNIMTNNTGIPVEVKWNEDFNKYKVTRIMPDATPITTASFFYHKNL
jgi:hypothetical protein